MPPPTHTSAHRVCAPVCVNFERNVNKQSAKDKNNNNQGIDLKRTLVKELTKNENKVWPNNPKLKYPEKFGQTLILIWQGIEKL